MQRKNKHFFMHKLLAFLWSGLMITAAQAGTPLWTFEPLTATTVAVPVNSIALVQYRVTNQSSKPHTLMMQPIHGITQITIGLGVCGNPFVLRGKDSCVLSLQINGSQLNNPIADGPVVCQQGSINQCYRPSAANILRIHSRPPLTNAVITVTGSPLTLTVNGLSGQLTISNTSTQVTATNIASDFTGTALDGNVTETNNACANVPPRGRCTLTYTPGNMVVPQTNFTIQGTNTNTLTTAIAIETTTLSTIVPTSGTASGGTGFILTGTGLTGTTSITFGGIAATSINVVNSTTVTGVTPAHTVGVVDVVIETPAGSTTLTNGYTYEASAVGQASGGGTIACLNGGLNNLIAATIDNSSDISWGNDSITINGALSNTDGVVNSTAIVATLGDNDGRPYAAQLCNNFQVDSQGNLDCQPGNACYNDWFLPAKDQLNCLFTNQDAIGGFDNLYWSSTELLSYTAWGQMFVTGYQLDVGKTNNLLVRCVRAFTP